MPVILNLPNDGTLYIVSHVVFPPIQLFLLVHHIHNFGAVMIHNVDIKYAGHMICDSCPKFIRSKES